ncbi:MAG: hypothetical protein ACFFCH_08635, partial [Promethearchaeota archaeon]
MEVIAIFQLFTLAIYFLMTAIPTIIVVAVVFWAIGGMMKDLTVTPKNAFIVATIGAIIGTLANFLTLFLIIWFMYIISLHLLEDYL